MPSIHSLDSSPHIRNFTVYVTVIIPVLQNICSKHSFNLRPAVSCNWSHSTTYRAAHGTIACVSIRGTDVSFRAPQQKRTATLNASVSVRSTCSTSPDVGICNSNGKLCLRWAEEVTLGCILPSRRQATGPSTITTTVDQTMMSSTTSQLSSILCRYTPASLDRHLVGQSRYQARHVNCILLVLWCHRRDVSNEWSLASTVSVDTWSQSCIK
jgi:hypothetical protein